jgi:hypothetical protein
VTVFAFDPDRKTNAQLMADVHTLGYINDTDTVLDLTYGEGRFWNDYRPPNLTTNDLHTDAQYAVDWAGSLVPRGWVRNLDVVVFDPPYKLNGTPSKGGPANSDHGYGVGEPATWQARMDKIVEGVRFAKGCVRPDGLLMVKCQDQVSSGAVRWQTLLVECFAGTGMTLVDMLFVSGHRPQPAGRRQVHAARNYSTLMIYKAATS